ncbi:hypothetical protein IT157_10940 [bacterium]|nr:hypothetical protein [bacterium]
MRHTAYELKFREPILTAKVRILKRCGFLFGAELDGKEFVSEAALMPRFGTERFEQAERVAQGETGNFISAPATLFGMDCIRWAFAQNFRNELQIPVATLLRETTNLAVGREAERAVRAGFTSAKMKIGLIPYPDEAGLIGTICHMAPKLRLRLDANLSVHEFSLRCLCEALPKEAIEWIEDPLRAGDDW